MYLGNPEYVMGLLLYKGHCNCKFFSYAMTKMFCSFLFYSITKRPPYLLTDKIQNFVRMTLIYHKYLQQNYNKTQQTCWKKPAWPIHQTNRAKVDGFISEPYITYFHSNHSWTVAMETKSVLWVLSKRVINRIQLSWNVFINEYEKCRPFFFCVLVSKTGFWSCEKVSFFSWILYSLECKTSSFLFKTICWFLLCKYLIKGMRFINNIIV